MDPRHPHVIKMLHLVPHHPGGDHRFGGHRDIGSPRRNHQDFPPAGLFRHLLLQGQAAGLAMVDSVGKDLSDLCGLRFLQPGHQDITPLVSHGSHDLFNLNDGFPLPQDHLG